MKQVSNQFKAYALIVCFQAQYEVFKFQDLIIGFQGNLSLGYGKCNSINHKSNFNTKEGFLPRILPFSERCKNNLK